MKPSIDVLPVQKSLIDLSELPKNSFDSVFYGYSLKSLLDDVLLIKFVDETDDGKNVIRNGIVVPINAETKAWRIGEVILSGPNAKLTKVGDYVCFPNNLGIPISNIEVVNYGLLKKGLFLNEQRIFGICGVRDDDNSIASTVLKSKKKISES